MQSNWIREPDSLGVATLIMTVLMGVTSIIIVILRTWTRVKTDTHRLDDALMVVATCVYISCCVISATAVFSGLGTSDTRLDEWNIMEGAKVSLSQPV